MSIVPIISNNYNVPIDGFRLDYVFQMQLGVSATFTVFLTHKGQQMYSKQITMSGDDYKKWGNDDEYVQQYVAKQLGFTIVPKPDPIAESLPVTNNSTESLPVVTNDSTESLPVVTNDSTGPLPVVTNDSTESLPVVTNNSSGPLPVVTSDSTGPLPAVTNDSTESLPVVTNDSNESLPVTNDSTGPSSV
jgi:hypothetical protein